MFLTPGVKYFLQIAIKYKDWVEKDFPLTRIDFCEHRYLKALLQTHKAAPWTFCSADPNLYIGLAIAC